MKKKLMMVAVLFGALSLGACVDDNESQSVTAVRNAKAEALKAVAALNNAKAAAETTMAAAQAEWYKAQAEYEKAKAAAENAKAELKQQKKEQAAQEFILKIQKLEAETQSAIAKAKKEIAEYENTIATQNNAKLATLYDNYSTALQTLMDLNKNLTSTQASIAHLEAGVEYAKAYAKTQITDCERNIAAYKAQIEVLKDPAYTNIDNKEIYAKYTAAQKKADLAWNTVYANEGAAAKAAGDMVKAAWEALNMKLIDDVNSMWWFGNIIGYNYDYDIEIKYVTNIYVTEWTGHGFLRKNFRINEANKLQADRHYAEQVANRLASLGAPADTKDKATAYGFLALANAKLAEANAMAETTDAEKEAKKTAIRNAEDEIARAKDGLANAQIAYDNTVAEKEAFDAAFAAVDIAAYNQASAAIAAAVEKQDAAVEAYDKAAETPIELSAEATALWNLYDNATNIDEQIASLEKSIADANKEIEYYKGKYVTDPEVTLTEANKKIEDLNAKIAVQTKIVDAAKAALDAALASAE